MSWIKIVETDKMEFLDVLITSIGLLTEYFCVEYYLANQIEIIEDDFEHSTMKI